MNSNEQNLVPKIFTHSRFGKLRLVVINGVVYFVAKDVATALNYKNTTEAIRYHVDPLDKREEKVLSPGGVQKIVLINKSGVYSLLLDSNMPMAKEYRHWVTSEVLPKIEETGSYSRVEISDPAVKKALKNSYRQFINVCVYVLLMSDDTVKIGYTKRLCKRISEIKSQFKLSVKDVHITTFMSCEKAQIVERCFKEIYSSQRMKGEIFSVDFDSACKTVNHFVELVSVPAIVSDFERGERLFQIAETMPDSPEKQRVLISSAKFIVGSKYD